MNDDNSNRRITATALSRTNNTHCRGILGKDLNTVELKSVKVTNLTRHDVRIMDASGVVMQVKGKGDQYRIEKDQYGDEYLWHIDTRYQSLPAKYSDSLVIEETYLIKDVLSLHNSDGFGLHMEESDLSILMDLLLSGEKYITRIFIARSDELLNNATGIYSNVGDLQISLMTEPEYQVHPWVQAATTGVAPDTGAAGLSVSLYDPESEYSSLYINVGGDVVRVRPIRQVTDDRKGVRVIKRNASGTVVMDKTYPVVDALSPVGIGGVYCYLSATEAMEDRHATGKREWLEEKEMLLKQAREDGYRKGIIEMERRVDEALEREAKTRKIRKDYYEKEASSKTGLISNGLKFATVAITAILGVGGFIAGLFG